MMLVSLTLSQSLAGSLCPRSDARVSAAELDSAGSGRTLLSFPSAQLSALRGQLFGKSLAWAGARASVPQSGPDAARQVQASLLSSPGAIGSCVKAAGLPLTQWPQREATLVTSWAHLHVFLFSNLCVF